MANAFGGTAQTYCLWAQVGEPFKEGNAWYIEVIHPLTKRPKKVRWYSDKKHADLMPKTKPSKPFCSLFGFKDEADSIVAIKKAHLSETEVTDYFSSQWRFCGLFGGIWYAPRTTELPAIKRSSNFFFPEWKEFRAEGQRYSVDLSLVPESESPWFQ